MFDDWTDTSLHFLLLKHSMANNCAIPGLFFLYFRLFEPRISGIGSDRSAN